MASGKGKSDDVQSVDVELQTLRSLFEVHKKDPSVLISNGFLIRIENDSAVQSQLTADEKAFLDKSLEEYNRFLEQEYDANQEYTQALSESEARAKELEQANRLAEEQKEIAEKLQADAEQDRDAIAKQLESTRQYELETNKWKWRFTVIRRHAWPFWGWMFTFLIGTMSLMYMEKPGHETLVPVLAGLGGTAIGMMATAFMSMFTPTVKEEQRPGKEQGAD